VSDPVPQYTAERPNAAARARGVDLIWMSTDVAPPEWPLGAVRQVDLSPAAITHLIDTSIQATGAEAWLFWDGTLGAPDPERIARVMSLPGDLWHAGLRLGCSALPQILDFIAPTWLFNRDPDPSIEATSWRLSLRACLVRLDVLRQMGGVRREFDSLEGAALEMGHRYISRGVLTRHVPWMLGDVPANPATERPSFQDELRFAYYRFGARWAKWALMRAVLTRHVGIHQALASWSVVRKSSRPPDPPPLRRHVAEQTSESTARVSVIIPTVDRYPYLRTLLEQLRTQSIRPCEIFVIDQTAPEHRDSTLAQDFADLPLHVLWRDHPGQCSSRNAALQIATGDYFLLLDDDVEVQPSLIEAHLRILSGLHCSVSSGEVEEVGVSPRLATPAHVRASNVCPAGNTLLHRSALQAAGTFDLAYERGSRADGDLGMRLYLSGCLMVRNPDASVLHHRAPRGGLRRHGARVITYASSRTRVGHRRLPETTELYFAHRYFSPDQVREALWLTAIGTFSIRGSLVRKALKLTIGVLYLPLTVLRLRRASRDAVRMMRRFPQIPLMPEAAAEVLSV
jgi:glycosyltransferase involved in cell wall biosynthesis